MEEKTAKGLRYGRALESHEWCEKVNGEGTSTMSYNRTTQERIKIIRQQMTNQVYFFTSCILKLWDSLPNTRSISNFKMGFDQFMEVHMPLTGRIY